MDMGFYLIHYGIVDNVGWPNIASKADSLTARDHFTDVE